MYNNPNEYRESKCNKKGIVLQSDKILLVEGADEWYFFYNLIEEKLRISDIQICDMKGKSNLSELLTLVKKSDFYHLKRRQLKIGLVLDADRSFSKTIEDITKHINTIFELSIESITINFSNTLPAISAYILPNNCDNGMLEDICLASVSGSHQMQCIEGYFECLKNMDIIPSEISKAKTMCYLASKDPFKTSIGFAATEGHWDYEQPAFKDLISYIKSF